MNRGEWREGVGGVAAVVFNNLGEPIAAVGITTREACGNSVRNVTGCPLAGICRTEAFDISPYAEALMRLVHESGDSRI